MSKTCDLTREQDHHTPQSDESCHCTRETGRRGRDSKLEGTSGLVDLSWFPIAARVVVKERNATPETIDGGFDASA